MYLINIELCTSIFPIGGPPTVQAASLGSVGCAIGGLLGEDDHGEAATMSPWCARQRMVLSSTRAAGRGGMAPSTSAATL
jgi:hypothetical protein